MSNNLNEIILFTTAGCEGCKIAEKLINKAIEQSNINIDFEVHPIENSIFGNLAKLYLIDDFPTALFNKRGKVVGKIVGTTTVDEIIKTINECFKSY